MQVHWAGQPIISCVRIISNDASYVFAVCSVQVVKLISILTVYRQKILYLYIGNKYRNDLHDLHDLHTLRTIFSTRIISNDASDVFTVCRS